MTTTTGRVGLLGVALVGVAVMGWSAQTEDTTVTDWPIYQGYGSNQYSPLDQLRSSRSDDR